MIHCKRDLRKERNFAVKMSAIVLGAIIYRAIIACALTISWLKSSVSTLGAAAHAG